MGMIQTFVRQLTAPFRDLQFAVMKVKMMLMQPVMRILGLQRGMTGDMKQLGRDVGIKPGGPPK